MGLLSDAQNRKKIGTIIVDHHRKVIIISFVAGIVWFLALASDNINNKTYFSENALLPGLVTRDFNPGSSPYRLLESLKEENKEHSLPHAWIKGQFRQIGLDVYTHNFSLNYPFGSKPQYKGKNIYAILRAPKSCSTEALVLSSPYRGRNSIHDTTLPSIALMIELAKYFRRHSFWSKDIIFLITEHEMIGFQAWLNAYHNIPDGFIDSGSLSGTSGLIQGVINLEISHEQFDGIDVKLEGLNGQLPNLDLFNLVVELCNREMITPLFQGQKTYARTTFLESWTHTLWTMVSMMGMQSIGLPTGGHGLFHRFGIQAVSLTSVRLDSRNSAKIGLVHMGRVLEGIYRSLNNLLEKFHQSFFFYLLSSTRHYSSIGLYMPPFALIAAAVLVKALYFYIDFKFKQQKQQDVLFHSNFSLWSALDLLIICHAIGLIIYFCPMFVNTFQTYFDYNTEDSLYYLHFFLVSVFVVGLFAHNKVQCLDQQQYSIKLCIVLLEMGAFFFTLSLINISLATVISLLYIPISVCLECRGYYSSLLHYIYLLLINPFAVTFIIVVVQSCVMQSDNTWLEHITHALTGHKKIILYTVEDMYFFGNWNYKITTLLLLPIWLELWSLASIRRL